MCVVEEDGQVRMTAAGAPEMRFAFLRRGDCEILDTWHVSGLRGTGSHDVVVHGKQVAREHTLSPADANTLDAPVGRIPIISTMAAGYASQVLGIGQLAIDTLVALTSTKIAVDPGPGLRDRPAVLTAIARSVAGLAAARAHLRSRAERLWDAATCGDAPTLEGITAVWGAALHAVAVARAALDALHAAGGTTSIFTDCPLERAHRDVHAMSRHIVAQDLWLEDAGRVELGMSPIHPLYAL
jgi:alkylation response protein AidB-like acyl-CoA dehydrogenase